MVGAGNVISCVLACGVEWMVNAWHLYASFMRYDSTQGYPITDARKEYIWCKVIEENSGLLCEEYRDPQQKRYIDTNRDAIVSLLATIVDHDCLCIPGLAVTIHTSTVRDRALTLAKSTRIGGVSIVDGNYILAVPTPLADQKFQRLNRFWVLEEVNLPSGVPAAQKPVHTESRSGRSLLGVSRRVYPQVPDDNWEIITGSFRDQRSTCEKAQAHVPLKGQTYLRLVDKFPLVGCPTIRADGEVVRIKLRQNVFG
jgi:hypothetical protein